MVSYKDLGLVNTRDMFAKAIKGGYAVPAFNFNNMEQLQAIIMASAETKSPVILQVSKGARNYANQTLLRYMAEGAVEYAKELGWAKPQIVLHLDHGDSFELCKSCVDMGFSSVMIDGSALPYDENVALTKQVVEYAHKYDVTVEGELGVLAGVEDEVASEVSHYTKPEEVVDFVTKTGVDSLAISIGTSHGAYKFTPEQCTVDPKTGRLVPPPLAFDVLAAIEKELPGFPIVLHGSSSVPQEDPQDQGGSRFGRQSRISGDLRHTKTSRAFARLVFVYNSKNRVFQHQQAERVNQFSVFPSEREEGLSPTISRIIQVSNGEKKNDKSTQPNGSRCLFFAIRYAMCIRKRYTSPSPAAIAKIISNTSHTNGSTTTRPVCKIMLIILLCKISVQILPCICGRDKLFGSYNKHNGPYTHIPSTKCSLPFPVRL